MTQTGYLSAKEAAEMLDITVSTLYSYVSRGLIRSEVADVSKRTHRYRREDVEKLKRRKEQRRDPSKVVDDALHWGTPLLESAITLIVHNQLYYRGHDVRQLAEKQTLEAVAALIWRGDLAASVPGLAADVSFSLSPRLEAVLEAIAHSTPMERLQALLSLAAAEDVAAYDLRAEAVVQTGARILRSMVTTITDGTTAGTIAQQLQHRWKADDPQAAELINRALILCADHELNVSSFTARCVASAGATLYQVVIAGLAALQGVKHGRATDRVEAFLREFDGPASVPAVLAARLQRGESLPGFGHPLYPDGDPRGQALLNWLAAAYPDSADVALAKEIAQQTEQLLGKRPTIDFGLVMLSRTLALPPGSALILFALGRTVGWIGHAIEAYRTDRIIRPRARYVGKLPE